MRTALYCIIEGGREWEITYGVPAVLNQVHVAQSNLVLELHHLNCAIYVTHKPNTMHIRTVYMCIIQLFLMITHVQMS